MAESGLKKFLLGILGPSGREYESDTTAYMREFLATHPEEVASQKKGRSVWWDKDARQRTEPPEAKNAPKSGGAEYTFKA